MPSKLNLAAITFFCLTWTPALAAFAQKEQRLQDLWIAFEKNGNGDITSVKLPPGATDAHFDAITEIPTLVSIEAPACRASAAALELLKAIPKLSNLSLDEAAEANDYVLAIKGVKTLKSLSLKKAALTNHGLDDLCSTHPQLRELNIAFTQVSYRFAVPLLQAMQDLESLEISHLQPETESPKRARPNFGAFASLPRLKKLQARGTTEITSDELLAFEGTCGLEILAVDWNRVRGYGKAALHLQRCHPQLALGGVIADSLAIPNSTNREGRLLRIRACTYPKFIQLPHEILGDLEQLKLVGARKLDFLGAMPKLEHLELDGLVMDTEELANLQTANSLTSLTVSRATIDREIADLLLAPPELKQLSLEGCEFVGNVAKKIQPETGKIKVQIVP
jgi:hypothetical protein